jgi:uncharacterized protein YndB with AHSA1/START domain
MTPMIRSLEVQTEGDRFLRLRRDFDAPRPLLWRAYTDPEIVRRWLWARDCPMIRCEMDVREGGSLRWVWRVPDGEMGLSGRYIEIVSGERIVHTELFDADWTGGETVVTLRFEDHGEMTRMDMLIEYSSEAARAGALKSGMTDGMEETYARLDTMLAAQAP